MSSQSSKTLGNPSEKDHDRQHIIADFTDIEVLGRPVPMYPQNPRTGSLGASILIMGGFMIQKTQTFDRASCGIFLSTQLPLSWTAFLRLKDGFQVTISTWRGLPLWSFLSLERKRGGTQIAVKL
jgi:hypothetical protein